MYTLRLISGVLHRARGEAVREESLDLRFVELVLVVPLVAILLALSVWPAAISEHSFPGDQPTAVVSEAAPMIVAASIATPNVDWLALSPALALLAAAAVCLLGAVLVPSSARRAFSAIVAGAGFVTAGSSPPSSSTARPEQQLLIAESMTRDRLAALTQVLVAGFGLLAVLVSWGDRRRDHVGEYYALLAAAGGGMAFFVSAENLMTLFLGLEWFSIALYILVALDTHRKESLEAGLKYLIVGSFGSAILLFGSALTYGATGELGFNAIRDATGADDSLFVAGMAMIIAGLAFKASAAPFHMWTPDVYEGAPTPVTAFMSAATKAVALVVTLRVLVTAFPEQAEIWSIAIAVLAVASLVIGNLAALAQKSVKRMLAYSSVSQAGFMLIAIAADNELGGRGAALLPDPVRRGVDRGLRRRRGPRARARPRRDADDAGGLGLGAPVPRRRDVGLHARLRRLPVHRRDDRQVLRLQRRVRGRLVVARRDRRDRDGGEHLLLPLRRPRRCTCARPRRGPTSWSRADHRPPTLRSRSRSVLQSP